MSQGPTPANNRERSAADAATDAAVPALPRVTPTTESLNTPAFTARQGAGAQASAEYIDTIRAPLTHAELLQDRATAHRHAVDEALRAAGGSACAAVLWSGYLGVCVAGAFGPLFDLKLFPGTAPSAGFLGVSLAVVGALIGGPHIRTCYRELRQAYHLIRTGNNASASEELARASAGLKEALRGSPADLGDIVTGWTPNRTAVVTGLTALYTLAMEQGRVEDRLLILAATVRALDTLPRGPQQYVVSQRIYQAFIVGLEELAFDPKRMIDPLTVRVCIDGAALAELGDKAAPNRFAAALLKIAERLTPEESLSVIMIAHEVSHQDSLERRSAAEMMLGKVQHLALPQRKYNWLSRLAFTSALEPDQYISIAAGLREVFPDLSETEKLCAESLIDNLERGLQGERELPAGEVIN